MTASCHIVRRRAKATGDLLVYNWFDSLFGAALVVGSTKGVVGLGFAQEAGTDATLHDFQHRWPDAKWSEATTPELSTWAHNALGGKDHDRARASVPLDLIGTSFQHHVWDALLKIVSGNTATYSQIATDIGQPTAIRAVGSAVGKNPVSVLIPCHRVRRKDGALGGYHWGIPIKQALLRHEHSK